MRKLIALIVSTFVLVPATAFARPIVTDGTCEGSAGVIAECGDDPLLASCKRFALVCEDIGGTFTSVPGTAEDLYCDDDNDLLPDCTLDWIVACVRAGGDFSWYDTIEESGECRGV